MIINGFHIDRLTVRAKKFQVMEFNYEGIPGKE